MSALDIFNKYAQALDEIGATDQTASTGAVRLALRLAIADAYAAGGALADDLAAIVASQAQTQATPDQRVAESAIGQLNRLAEWLAEEEPALYEDSNLDTAAAVLKAIRNRDHDLRMARRFTPEIERAAVGQLTILTQWLAEEEPGIASGQIRSTADAVLDAIKRRGDDLQAAIAERDSLRQQLAQMYADEATLRLEITGLQREVDRLANDTVLVNAQNENVFLRQRLGDANQLLADAQAEIDRLTRQNVIATDTFNTLAAERTNGHATPLPISINQVFWWDNLDAETNDYRISLDAGRRKFREVPRPARLLLAQAVARHIGGGNLPKQSEFDAYGPDWMPVATGLVSTFNCTWHDLLALDPATVAA